MHKNKKLNSVLFILGATVANIIVMTAAFFLLLVLFARFAAPVLPAWANQLGLLLIFVGAVVGTYFLYHAFMKYLQKRVKLEEHFGPIFSRRKR